MMMMMWFRVFPLLIGAVNIHLVISGDVGENYNCRCSMEYDVSHEVCYTCCCYDAQGTGGFFASTICDNATIIVPGAIWTLNETQTVNNTCQSLNNQTYTNISSQRYFLLGETQCNMTSKQCFYPCTSVQDFSCSSKMFGNGPQQLTAMMDCTMGQTTSFNQGFQDKCILTPLHNLLNQSQTLNSTTMPTFLEQLRNMTTNDTQTITGSPANIDAIIQILSNVANRSSQLIITINPDSMTNILETTGILTSDNAKNSWDLLNQRDTNSSLGSNGGAVIKSSSSSLLNSFEIITSRLANGSFNIQTPYIQLNKTTFTKTFNGDFNSSVEIDISQADGENKYITIILFASMDNVLPARDESNSSSEVINGKVTLIQSEATITNITLAFEIMNDNLVKPKCVFWDFNLFNGRGGWSNHGCTLVLHGNENITCNCNHTTSFSILMSPESPVDDLLDSITLIGVGISMGSLVICLITEALLWKTLEQTSTSYLRHVTIVNIAVSLLIANIWFFIGGAISNVEKSFPPACTLATFFIHFFYLAMFFWMLASALLLFYRTVKVFHGGLSNRSMLVIGFSLGYGAPVLIATITIAVTAPSNEYMRGNNVCWLNWNESKALLAFVVPALLIVLINLIIVVWVVYKMLRRKIEVNVDADERHVLMVIARSLAVLTPFFGLTWSLGVGTMIYPQSRNMQIAFACSNSVQGFFIWVLGTLIDKKVQSKMATSLNSQG